MNKMQKIMFYKKQEQTAKDLQEISMQNYNLATRLESEAKRALELLGNKPERTRKGNVLSTELQTKLRAGLTK
jgi:DNA mismatch repair ATPase MutS